MLVLDFDRLIGFKKYSSNICLLTGHEIDPSSYFFLVYEFRTHSQTCYSGLSFGADLSMNRPFANTTHSIYYS